MGGWTGLGKDTIIWDGDIHAKNFYGNGSNLTGITIDLSSFTTDDLDEGSTNLYFTNARATTAVSTQDAYLKNTGDTASGNYNFDVGTFVIDATNNNIGIGKTNPNPNYRIDMTTKSSSWGGGFNIKDSTDASSIFHVSENGSKIGAMRLYSSGTEKVFLNAGGTSTFANGVTANFFNTNGYVQAGAEGYFGDGYVINAYDYLGNGDWGIYDGSSDGTIATFDGNDYYYGNRYLQVSHSNGNTLFNTDTIRIVSARTPSSASATGNPGDICWSSGYIYVCVGTNTWKRAALSTW